MTTWLKLLPLEMDEIAESEVVEPKGPLDSKKDNVVGEASLDLKRLYTLWMRAEKEVHQLMFNLRFSENPLTDLEEVKGKLKKLEDESETLKAIFWTSLREEHNLWDCPGVGIRRGWKVVSFEDEEPQLPPGFKGMFGPYKM